MSRSRIPGILATGLLSLIFVGIPAMMGQWKIAVFWGVAFAAAIVLDYFKVKWRWDE